MPEIDVYAVGVLGALHQRGRRFRALRYELRYLWLQAKRGEWRAVKNAFNGYLAEPRTWPTGLVRCGSGWTRARALRSLRRHARRAESRYWVREASDG